MTSQTTLITFETVPIHRPMCQMFLVIVYSSSFAPRTQAFCFEGDSLTTCRINPAFDMHITRGRRSLWKNRVSERKSERQHDSKGMYSLFDHKDVYHTGQSKPQRCVHPTRMGNVRSPGSTGCLMKTWWSTHCAFNNKLFRVVIFIVMFSKIFQLYWQFNI